MSKITLAPNASGTGTLTVAAPNTNSDYTLTLPANTGTILTTASSGLGKVLQVVNVTYSTYSTTTSTTFQDSGLTASITPTSATSKILVLVTCFVGKTDSDTGVNLRLLRNSTEISLFVDGAAQNDSSTRNLNIGVGHNYLDSPATTSSTTYKIQFAKDTDAAGTVVFNWYQGSQTTKSTITLMEIAA